MGLYKIAIDHAVGDAGTIGESSRRFLQGRMDRHAPTTHRLGELFAQLGLPNSAVDIAHF
jgi:hypothetical protein